MSAFNRSLYRTLVKDLMAPNLTIFWRDFLLSYAAFVGGLAVFLLGLPGLEVVGFLVATVMAYRCASYVHEAVHLPKEEFKSFLIGWNALIGIPFLMPSLLYESHLEHHIPRTYGTKLDPEYKAMKGQGFLTLLGFVLHHALATPLILYVRLLVGLPVRLLSKSLSDTLDRRFSSLVINWQYERNFGKAKRLVMLLEGFVLLMNITGTILISQGLLDPVLVLKTVSVILTALVLNGLRTLTAHQYHNMELEPVDAETQLLDSTNYDGPAWIGLMMAPVGLRFHALHHLFPTLPYHNLQTAHRRLMADLPEDDVYRKTVFTSFGKQLWTLMKPLDDGAERGRPASA